ncbi:TPA: GNAT family N-acetyltransferase [Escherichia coli]
MGRLAVSQPSKGTGVGGALLADTLYRAYPSEIAAYSLIVDAKDDTAIAFYKHYGFRTLPESVRTLFMPLASLSAIK